MNNLAILNQNQQTMSSREIAQLCEKEHRHVLRDIRAYLGAIVQMERGIDVRSMDWDGKEGIELFGHTSIGGVTAKYEINAQNKQSYLVYHLDKNATLTIISGYNILLRKRIIDRWSELEAQNTLPNFSNPVEAARAWADAVEKQQLAIAQVAQLQPKADALDAITHAKGNSNIRDTAKSLGAKQSKFISWCLTHGWLYRDDCERLKAYANRLQQGFMAQKSVLYRGSDSTERATMQPMFTPKGLTHLAKIYNSAVA